MPKPGNAVDEHQAAQERHDDAAHPGGDTRLGPAQQRAEKVERSFQHTLDRGGMRRVHLRGNENIRKRYLIRVAVFNLSLVMRQALGYGTPRGFADERKVCFVLIYVTTEAAAATYPAIQVVIQAAVGTGAPIAFSRHTTFAERL